MLKHQGWGVLQTEKGSENLGLWGWSGWIWKRKSWQNQYKSVIQYDFYLEYSYSTHLWIILPVCITHCKTSTKMEYDPFLCFDLSDLIVELTTFQIDWKSYIHEIKAHELQCTKQQCKWAGRWVLLWDAVGRPLWLCPTPTPLSLIWAHPTWDPTWPL